MKITFDNDKHNYLDIHYNEASDGIVIAMSTGKKADDGSSKSTVSSVEVTMEQFMDMLEDLNI